jgi:hypothetical protein
MIIFRIVSGAAGMMLLSAAIASSTMADTVSDFYTGKQVTIVVTAGLRGGNPVFTIAGTLFQEIPARPSQLRHPEHERRRRNQGGELPL